MNKHGYVIWWAEGDYKKLQFQTESAIMKVLLAEYGDTPAMEKALPKLMHVTELTWKKIRGRDIPIIPKE